jgi:hypothetical protein
MRLHEWNGQIFDGIRNLRVSQIQLRERLEGRERDCVVGHLLAKRGVRDVEYRDDDRARLVVEYDADQLSGAELVNFLSVCWLSARRFVAED